MAQDFRKANQAIKATETLFHTILLTGKTQNPDGSSPDTSTSGRRFNSPLNASLFLKNINTAGPQRGIVPPQSNPARTARPGTFLTLTLPGRVNYIIRLFISKTTFEINEVWNAAKNAASIFAGELENVIKTRTL